MNPIIFKKISDLVDTSCLYRNEKFKNEISSQEYYKGLNFIFQDSESIRLTLYHVDNRSKIYVTVKVSFLFQVEAIILLL